MSIDEAEDFDADDRRPRPDAPRFPGGVRAAGVIWIGVGAVALANMSATFAMNAGKPNGQTGGECCSAFIGIAFLVCGLQTVRGTAKDTRGNGIGSILLGVLYLAVAIVGFVLLGNRGPNKMPDELTAAIAALGGGLGLMLITAGVLALAGRSRYRAWRQANAPRAYGRDRAHEE